MSKAMKELWEAWGKLLQLLDWLSIKLKGGVLMNDEQYREAIERTMNSDLTEVEKLTMLALGIAGEAGEVVDILKKVLCHGHEMNLEEFILELGDLEYYLQHVKKHFGISDEVVRAKNIEKLKKRYPNGFSKEASINRVI